MNEERCHDNLKEQLPDEFKMPRYYCTCKKGEKLPHDYQHTKYHETEVDKEGLCVYCGYMLF